MKEIKLTPKEAINIVCDDSKIYKLLHLHEVKVYYGDMTTEYTFDVIFKIKETKEQFVIQNLNIVEGCSTRWFENDNLEDDFLDNCETDEITSFTAKPCSYKPGPPYTIIN